MKKGILAALIILFFAACNEKKSNKNLQITGNVEGLKLGILYVQHIKNGVFENLDTIKIDGDSHFEAEFDIKSPEMFYLILYRGLTSSIDDKIPFFVEPGTITINTKLEAFFSKAEIKGSKNQELFEEFRKINAKYTGESLTLMELKLNALRFKKNVSMDSIAVEEQKILKKKYLYGVNFAINNKDYEVAPYITLSELNSINLKYLDTIQKSMSPKVAKSLYGKQLIDFYNARKKAENK
jgi:hypothetical protein